MTTKQIENFRKALSVSLGPYAFIMPDAEVIAIRDKMQADIDGAFPKQMVKCPVCQGDKTVYASIDDLTKKPPTKTGVDLTCGECDGLGEVPAEHLKGIPDE